MKTLLLSGPNHGFNNCAPIIQQNLSTQTDLELTLDDDKNLLASPQLNEFDVCIFGTGFTRTIAQPEGPPIREPDLTPDQEEGLLNFVAGGKGLVGIHGTAWWIGGRAVDLIGGHANWHPPGLKFTVQIDDPQHQITRDVDNFEVEDEIYMSAWDPTIHILASAEWSERQHPMAWVKPYGQGKVFYTTLGHGPGTFEQAGMQALLAGGVRWAGTH